MKNMYLVENEDMNEGVYLNYNCSREGSKRPKKRSLFLTAGGATIFKKYSLSFFAAYESMGLPDSTIETCRHLGVLICYCKLRDSSASASSFATIFTFVVNVNLATKIDIERLVTLWIHQS